MSKTLRLGFSLLALTAITTFPTLAATPQPAPIGTKRTGVGGTMDQACAAAIQNLRNVCTYMTAPTTDPQGCRPLLNLEGQVIGQICKCEATTLTCVNPL